MSRRRKIAVGVAVAVVGVLALAFLVPALVDVDRYRPQVVAHLRESTGRPAQIGHLALTIFPVSIRLDDLALGNPSGFPAGDFVRARRVYAEVDALALWDHRIVIKALDLDRPAITLLSDGRGRWNFERVSSAKRSEGWERRPSADPPPAFTLGVIGKIKLTGGQVTAATVLPSGEVGPASFAASEISTELEQLDLGALGTPTQSGSPESSKPAAPLSAPARGTLRAASISLGTIQATNVKSRLRLQARRVSFDDLSFGFYRGQGTGDLSLDFAGPAASYTANARLRGVDLSSLLAQFPRARGKLTGTLEGSLSLSGGLERSSQPLADQRGSGQVTIRNGRLPTLELNKNLMLLASLASLGPTAGDPSSFSSLSADLNIARGSIRSDKIALRGNAVDVDGSGSVTPAGAGALGYSGVAKVRAAQNALTNILAGVSGGTFAEGKLSFPFALEGTVEHPLFRLKSARSFGGLKLP